MFELNHGDVILIGMSVITAIALMVGVGLML